MKRLCIMLICVLCVVCMVGCGKKEEKPIENETNQVDIEQNDTEVTDDKSEDEVKEDVEALYDAYAKVGGESIYINFKEGLRRKNSNGTSFVFSGSSVDIVEFVFDKENDFAGTYLDVFNYMNDGRTLSNMYAYSDADFHEFEIPFIIEKKSEEHVVINDRDMQRFTGNVVDLNGRNCYVYGYAFVIEDIPCMLVGFVLSEEQEQSLIDSIHEEVDIMIKTVRTEY